jgi:hypothetical protein
MHLSFLSSYKKEFRAYLSLNKENLKSSEITIKSSELYKNSQTIIWEDDNKEIVYKGVLYDVISIRSNKENVIVTVFSDTQEVEIKNQFAANYNDISSKTANKPMKLLKQFLALQYISPTTELFNSVSASTILVNHKDYHFYISSGFLSQETPPPNLST